MDDNDIISVIDYGKSKIRLAIFNKHFKKLYSKSNKVEKDRIFESGIYSTFFHPQNIIY